MIDWIGEREYKIYAWSESDRDQILHEMKAKKLMISESIRLLMNPDG